MRAETSATLLAVADELGYVHPAQARQDLIALRCRLRSEFHCEPDEDSEYPVVAQYAFMDEPVRPRNGDGVALLVGLIGQVVDDLGISGPSDDEVVLLRRFLYGLHALDSVQQRAEERPIVHVVGMTHVDRRAAGAQARSRRVAGA